MTTVQTSSYRSELPSKMDIDPGYFCKYLRDQIVLKSLQDEQIEHIIDVGCDRGHIPYILQQRGMKFSYTGLDLDTSRFYPEVLDAELITCPDSIATISHIKNHVAANSYSNENDVLRKRTTILLLDVIEHMDTYEHGIELMLTALETISKLKLGGIVYVSTPNRQSSKRTDVNWPKYHTFEFTLHELFTELLRAGYAGKQIEEIGWSMSNDIFKSKFTNASRVSEIVPIEINRVLAATGFPEYSRDILLKIYVQPTE